MEALETIEKVFAHNLRVLRGKSTQADMAERLSMPLRTYQKFEAAQVIPQAETRRQLADKLGVPETRLFQDPDLARVPGADLLREALALLAPLDQDQLYDTLRFLRGLNGVSSSEVSGSSKKSK